MLTRLRCRSLAQSDEVLHLMVRGAALDVRCGYLLRNARVPLKVEQMLVLQRS